VQASSSRDNIALVRYYTMCVVYTGETSKRFLAGMGKQGDE
jgi:hypothetical protein